MQKFRLLKKQDEEGGEYVKCPHCGNNRVIESDNFCGKCGRKLKDFCNCWIKKDSYDCGEDSCPGYGLFALEKSREK